MGSSKAIHRILVADDDLQIGALVRETLSQMGHVVEICRDGEAALRKFDESGARWSMLVLDVVMPAKTGVEVVQALRDRREKVPVLLMSSFISDDVVNACAGYERIAFLQKPFSLGEFRATVERLTKPVRC